MSYDKINPSHYKDSPSKCEECGGPIEAIVVTEQMNFNLGNAVKYVWRAGKKPGSDIVEDLKKARWYLDREIQRIEKELTSKAIDVLSSQATEKGCSGECKQKELPDSLRAAITSVCCSPEVSADTIIKPGYVQEQLAQTIQRRKVKA